ncbi:MAG: CRISPR-associated endonuclease Cas2 [Candidatus Micrarchaeia archaeon]
MIILAYDIASNKERKKAADVCLDSGLWRIQNSVFAGPVSWNKAESIGMKIDLICSGRMDKVVIFHSCKVCSSKVITLKKQITPQHHSTPFFIICNENLSSFVSKGKTHLSSSV